MVGAGRRFVKGGAVAYDSRPSSATEISRIRNFWTLPVTVIGNVSTSFQ